MNQNKLIVSVLVAIGTLAIAIGPAWSQARPGQGQPDPASPGGVQSPGQGGDQGSQDIRKERGQESPIGEGSEGRQAREGRGLDKEQVKKIQEALKEKGHDPGPADGVLGPKTQQALKEFQSASGLKATGSIDSQTQRALGVEGAVESGKGASEGGMSREEGSGGASPKRQQPGERSGAGPGGG